MSIKIENTPSLKDLKEVLRSYTPKRNAQSGYLERGQVRQTFYNGLVDLVEQIRKGRTIH